MYFNPGTQAEAKNILNFKTPPKMKDYKLTMVEPAQDVTPPQKMERNNRFSLALKRPQNNQPELSLNRLQLVAMDFGDDEKSEEEKEPKKEKIAMFALNQVISSNSAKKFPKKRSSSVSIDMNLEKSI